MMGSSGTVRKDEIRLQLSREMNLKRVIKSKKVTETLSMSKGQIRKN
jgi:hypothetical protein